MSSGSPPSTTRSSRPPRSRRAVSAERQAAIGERQQAGSVPPHVVDPPARSRCRSSRPTRSRRSASPCAASAWASARTTRGAARRPGEPPTELWEALSAAGFTGINIPQAWGGGGLGMTGLTLVAEEIAAAIGMTTLMLVVSPAIAGTILALHGTPEQQERWLRGIAAGTTKLAFAHHRARRGHELAQPAHRGAPRRRPLPALRPEDLHLRRRGRGRRARRRPLPPRRTASSGSRRSASSTWTRPASRATRSRCPTSARTGSGRSSSTTSRSSRERIVGGEEGGPRRSPSTA